jgi:hypothetical protein
VIGPSISVEGMIVAEVLMSSSVALERCIEEGHMTSPPAVEGVPVAEDCGFEEREREWEAMLMEKGAELKQVMLLSFVWFCFSSRRSVSMIAI